MREGMRGLIMAALIGGLASTAFAGYDGKLAAPVEVKRAGKDVTISFALTAPADVTVRVVNAKGEVIRHLASGVVGLERAAAPFAAGALAQKVEYSETKELSVP